MNQAEIIFNGRKVAGFWRDEVDESVWAEIFKWREYRQAEETIKNAKVILDAGAHAGFFSLYCRALNQQAQVVALEPEPENFQWLKKNLALNGVKDVDCLEAALATRSEKRRLAIAPDSHNHYLLPTNEKVENQISVRCFSLSDVCQKFKIKKIDLLKLDIEGGEYELLSGWSVGDWGLVKEMIVEYHDQPGRRHAVLEEILRLNGCSVQKFPSRFDKTMGFFFVHNKRNK